MLDSEENSPTEHIPVAPVEVVRDMVPITTVRDLICMVTGSALCLSQPGLQLWGYIIGKPFDVSLAILGAGVTLLLEIPFLHVGDRRLREARNGHRR